MKAKTLIVGFKPLDNLENLKPAAVREQKYFSDLFGRYYLGEVHYVGVGEDYNKKAEEINPIIAIVFSDQTAEEFKGFKKDCFIYSLETYRQLIRNKSTEKQEGKIKEAEGLVKYIESQENDKPARAYAAMTYKDMYETVKRMITSGDKELGKKAWELLNQNHGNWPWMRTNLIIDCWQSSDAKGREEYIMIYIKNHMDSGAAKQIEDFTDKDGTVCRQFQYADGHVYRVPRAGDGTDKYAYEDLVKKYNKDNAQPDISIKQNKPPFLPARARAGK